MKAVLCNWAGSAKNLPAWFVHDTEIDISPEQIQELYDTGNNVMLKHSHQHADVMVVFVDDRSFTQR